MTTSRHLIAIACLLPLVSGTTYYAFSHHMETWSLKSRFSSHDETIQHLKRRIEDLEDREWRLRFHVNDAMNRLDDLEKKPR